LRWRPVSARRCGARKDLPVTDFQTLKHIAEVSVFSRRFEMILLAAFALLALLLAAVGIYGVMSYLAQSRDVGRGGLGARSGSRAGLTRSATPWPVRCR